MLFEHVAVSNSALSVLPRYAIRAYCCTLSVRRHTGNIKMNETGFLLLRSNLCIFCECVEGHTCEQKTPILCDPGALREVDKRCLGTERRGN